MRTQWRWLGDLPAEVQPSEWLHPAHTETKRWVTLFFVCCDCSSWQSFLQGNDLSLVIWCLFFSLQCASNFIAGCAVVRTCMTIDETPAADMVIPIWMLLNENLYFKNKMIVSYNPKGKISGNSVSVFFGGNFFWCVIFFKRKFCTYRHDLSS